MNVKRDKFGDWFIYIEKMSPRYRLDEVGRRPPRINEVVDEIDPNMSLDFTGYYYGLPSLRRGIIEIQKYETITEENVLTTYGTYEANYLATMVLVEPGDEVVIETPAWKQVSVLSAALGARIRTFENQEKDKWHIDLDQLNEVVSPKTKMIFINHPNNPTGAVLDSREMNALCEMAKDCGAWVISDEVYRGLEWDNIVSPSIVNYYDKGITTGSFSKTVGIRGLRIGWLATRDKEIFQKCFTLHRYSVMGNNVLSEHIATAAVQPDVYYPIVKAAKRMGRKNKRILEDYISKSDVLHCVPSRGGYLSFVGFNLEIGSWDLCKFILEEPYKTALVPGIGYGEAFDKYIRIGFGEETTAFKKGLEQVDEALKTVASHQGLSTRSAHGHRHSTGR